MSAFEIAVVSLVGISAVCLIEQFVRNRLRMPPAVRREKDLLGRKRR
ncbi:MAG TPA: hypothetical protein VGA20_06150 [Gemmatimonadales bacterium]